MNSLASTLLELRSTSAGRKLILSKDPVSEAKRLCSEDPYQENARMLAALHSAGADHDTALQQWYEHLVLVARRESAYMEKSPVFTPLEYDIHGKPWLLETINYPTLFVSPMTLALPDVLSVMNNIIVDRPLVIYGESMSVASYGPLAKFAAGDGLNAVRRIRSTLRRNGILCTYPDFVYEGHSAIRVNLLGYSRPLSSGFVNLAAQHGAMLLPVSLVMASKEERLRIEFDEPMLIPKLDKTALCNERIYLAQCIADMLTSLIRRYPTQWLLLPTLTFDSPQIAS